MAQEDADYNGEREGDEEETRSSHAPQSFLERGHADVLRKAADFSQSGAQANSDASVGVALDPKDTKAAEEARAIRGEQ